MQVEAHQRAWEREERDPGRLDRAGGNDHRGVGLDAQELATAMDIHLECVDGAAALVEADDMGAGHQKDAPIGIVAAGVPGVLADRADEARHGAVLVEAEQPRCRSLALHRKRRFDDAVGADAKIDVGNPRCGRLASAA